ncbi:hypothetical protein LCGC14_1937760, partial [marine sediment metagenome]
MEEDRLSPWYLKITCINAKTMVSI